MAAAVTGHGGRARWRWRHLVVLATAAVAITLAVLLGLLQLALPWWASDAGRVAALLQRQVGAPVTIDAARPYWTVRGPLIELEGVRFGDEDARIGQAALAIDLSGLVRRDRPLYEFRVHDLDLTLSRDADGRWQLLGLPGLMSGGGGQPVTRLLRGLPSVAVRDSRLHLRLAADDRAWSFHLPEIRRFSQGGIAKWRGRLASPAGTGGELLLAMDSGSDDWARIHIHGDGLAMAHWLDGQTPAGISLVEGRLHLSAWLELDGGGITDAQLQWRQGASRWRSTAPQVLPAGSTGAGDPGHDSGPATAVDLPPLSALARWQRQDDAGRLLVEQLRFGPAAGRGSDHADDGDGAEGVITGVWQAGRLRLQASDLELSPLLPLAALSAALPDGARHWLAQAQARLPLRWAQLDWDDHGLRQYRLHLAGVRSRPVAPVPGLDLPPLAVAGDRAGLVLMPSPGPVRLDFPGVFAAPLAADIVTGGIAAWATPDGWRLDSDGLELAGADYQGTVTGGVEIRQPPPVPGNGGPDIEATSDAIASAGTDADTGTAHAAQAPRRMQLWLDLGLQASGQVLAANAFWPRNKIARTADWLERALAGGRLVTGRAWLRGPAGPFPFPDQRGHFEAIADVEGAALDFHPQWPGLSDVDAALLFENGSLHIDASRARIGGLAVTGARASIENLKQPILTASGHGQDSGEQLLGFLARTPVQAIIGEHLAGRSIQGRPQVSVELRLPLKRELGEAAVDGRIGFAGESYHDAAWNLALDDLHGELVFDRHGLSARDLDLRMAGEPAQLDLRIAQATADPAMALEARLTGHLSTAALLAGFDWAQPLAQASPGQASWQVDLQVPERRRNDGAPGREGRAVDGRLAGAGSGTGQALDTAADSDPADGRLTLRSDLAGIALQLPAPLRKPAGTVLPFTLVVGTGAGDGGDGQDGEGDRARPLQLALGNLLAMNLRLPVGVLPGSGTAAAQRADDALRGAVVLGASEAGLPPPAGLLISGQTAALDVAGWLGLGAGLGLGDGAGSGWPQVRVSAGELIVLGRSLRDVELRVKPGDGGIDIGLAGPDVAGHARWFPAGSPGAVAAQGGATAAASVQAQLSHLHLSGPDPMAAAGPGTGAGPAATGAGPMLPGSVDPASLPALDIDVGSLALGPLQLGQVRLQGQPDGRGFQIAQFDTDSALFAIQAEGEWWRSRGEERSQFVIELATGDLGAMLTSFGFQGAVDGGRTQARIDGGWIGPPAAFSLAGIDGTLTVNVGDGRIREVDPGVGRLFGLLNLREIPRRLMLDFRDFFGQGLRFSSIQGSFRLNTGNAFTDGIEVKSPSADILVSGRTGLAARDYDQTIQVRPRLGGTFPVVGAIAGGPAGAAAGLVVQSLLRIDDASRIVYRVTGPWEEPVIVRQDEAESGPATPPAND